MSYYSVVIIKPDAHKDMLVEMILDDFKNNGLNIVFHKDLVLSREQAETIYKGESGKETYEHAIKSIMPTEGSINVTMAIIKSKNEVSALNIAHEVRGKSGKSGVRSKYQVYTKDELRKKNISENEILSNLAKNRLHVPDTDREAMELIDLLTTPAEKDDIKEREPQLYKELLRESKAEMGKKMMKLR